MEDGSEWENEIKTEVERCYKTMKETEVLSSTEGRSTRPENLAVKTQCTNPKIGKRLKKNC